MDYQRGSLGKSHQNCDYLKQAWQKSCRLTEFKPASYLKLLRKTKQLFRIACYD